MRELAFESAAPLWARIAEIAPHDIESGMAMARIHVRGGKPFEALDLLAEVLAKKPGHGEAEKLRSAIAHGQISRIANEINAQNAKQFDLTFEALAIRLGDDPYLERVRSYAALIAAPDYAPAQAARQKISRSSKRARGDGSSFPEETGRSFVERVERLDENAPAGLADEMRHRAELLVRENVWMAHAISAAFFKRGDFETAKSIYAGMAVDESEFWLEAVRRVVERKEPGLAAEYSIRAAACSDADLTSLGKASKKLAAAGAVDAALALWRGLPDYGTNIMAAAEVLRILADAARFEEFMNAFRALLKDTVPAGPLSEAEAKALVSALQLLRRVSERHRADAALASLYAIASEQDDGSALASWTRGVLANARHDRGLAVQCFEEARSREGDLTSLGVDLDGEIALLHARYHDYGAANAALRRMNDTNKASAGYLNKLARVKEVADFCGPGATLFPECLIDIIFDEIPKMRLAYEPQQGHLLTIGSSLRQGGSERQTVTVLGGLCADPRIRKCVLALRTAGNEDRAPFLRQARELPIELVHYGDDWQHDSDLRTGLPEIEANARLAGAIELLPRNHREDIIRIGKLIQRVRPQAVHLRQDMFAAAIACVLMGVPKFAIHRGSVSPDLWGHGELETNLHLRPMRHTYRHLLARPEFVLINNSAAGLETDRAWTEWPDASPFRVVHNAVQFEKLGADTSRNDGLRSALGIGSDDFLIGGVFRVSPVKRPMLWIEIARRVAETRADVHFAIAGDGEMANDMRSYAAAHGFGERLHMPGLVSDVGLWYRAMDINLLTSEREGLPNVLIEGQHFGVPAVSADVGGAFETIEPGTTGFLIARDAGAEAYADAILRILSDADWRETARMRAPSFVHEKFGMTHAVDAVLRCLGMEQIVSES